MKRFFRIAAAVSTVFFLTNAFVSCQESKESVHVSGVSVDRGTVTLNVGDSCTVIATVSPADAADKSVLWSSGDENVASVNGGLIKAVAEGKAVITVTTVDGGKTATCEVTVMQGTYKPVRKIAVSKPWIIQDVKGKDFLTVKITPVGATNKNIIWQVQQGGVLTLDNGIYTANKEGQCNVTAKTEDGGYTCTITVTVKAVSVTGVSISKQSLSLKVGTSQQLTATVHPDNATNKGVTWKSSNPGVATVTSGTGIVKAVSKGTATITVTTSDGSKKATCNVTVYADPTGGESEGVDFEDL